MSDPLPALWLPLAAGVFGWVWGSFLNTIVDRTPRREGAGPLLGWFTPPRSVCLSCAVPIPWYDNLPIVSYLWLRGRCRTCGATIGRRTLVVETVTPTVFALLGVLVQRDVRWCWTFWWAAALSTVIVAVPLWQEGRRWTPVIVAVAVLAPTALGLVVVR